MKKKNFISQTQVVSVVLITGVALILAGTAYYWSMPLLEKTKKSMELQDAETFLLDLIDAIEEVAETGDVKTIETNINGEFIILPDKDEIIYRIRSPSLAYATTTYVPINDIPPFKKKVIVFSSDETKEVPELNKSKSVKCFATLDCSKEAFIFDTSTCAVSNDTYYNMEEIISTKDPNIKYLAITSYCDTYNLGYLELEKEEKLAGIKGENHNLVLLVKAIGNEERKMFVNMYRIISREIIDEKNQIGYYIDFVGDPKKIEGNTNIKIIISRESSDVIPGGSSFGGDLNIIKIKVEAYQS